MRFDFDSFDLVRKDDAGFLKEPEVARRDAIRKLLLVAAFVLNSTDIAAFTAAQVDDDRYVGAAPAISN